MSTSSPAPAATFPRQRAARRVHAPDQLAGFKTLRRSGISVSAGDRVGLGVLTIGVGGLAETVTVEAESPLVQTQSGERSFTVTTKAVENLPIANRSFVQLATLAPGVAGPAPIPRDRRRRREQHHDGRVSAMDTGSNAILLQMNVESIAEVKVLVSNYQAEFGRSSGLQITAVTKSGTNRFRGSAYGVVRNDDVEFQQQDEHAQRRSRRPC